MKTAIGSATFRPASPELAHNLFVLSTVKSTGANIGGKQVSTSALTPTGGIGATATHASDSVVDSNPAGGGQQTSRSKVTFKQLIALVIT